MEAYPPRDRLRFSEVASEDSRPGPLLYRFGIPFTCDYALRYAAKHHFTIKLLDEFTAIFDDVDVLDFADIRMKHIADDSEGDLRAFLMKVPLG